MQYSCNGNATGEPYIITLSENKNHIRIGRRIPFYSFWNLRLTLIRFAVNETIFWASCTIFR